MGDFDSQEALALFRRHMGDIPAGPTPLPVPDNEPPQAGDRRVEYHHAAQAPAFLAGYHAPAIGADDLYPLEVLSTLLSGGESSRLHRRLVYEEQIALSVAASYAWRLYPALFTVHVELQPGKSSAGAEKSVYDEIARVARERIAADDLLFLLVANAGDVKAQVESLAPVEVRPLD